MAAQYQEVETEKLRLSSALKRLETAIELYGKQLETNAKSRVTTTTSSELDNLRDEIKNLQNTLAEAKRDLSVNAVELVKLKEENKVLREKNAKVAALLAESIKDIEDMVA